MDELSAPGLSERLAELVIDEAVTEAAIGRPVTFLDRCFSRCRPSNWSGRSVWQLPPHRKGTRR